MLHASPREEMKEGLVLAHRWKKAADLAQEEKGVIAMMMIIEIFSISFLLLSFLCSTLLFQDNYPGYLEYIPQILYTSKLSLTTAREKRNEAQSRFLL
jgi:hypothetical protein